MRTRHKVVATAVVGALLLAGGGTFALWSVEGRLTPDAVVTAGDLSLTTPDEFSVYDVSDGGEAEITDLADWRIVPGDTLAFRSTADITLEGNNLTADLALTGLDDLVGGIPGVYGVTVEFEDSDLPPVTQEDIEPGSGDTIEIATGLTAADAALTAHVEVRFTFDDVDGVEAVNETITLDALRLSLTQRR